MAAESAPLTQALFSGIFSEPLPQPERCAHGWIPVPRGSTGTPCALESDSEADVRPRKALQAAVTVGGGLQECHWLSGRGLRGVFVDHQHRGRGTPQGSPRASGRMEAQGVHEPSAPSWPSGFGWTSSGSRQPDILPREERLLRAAVQARPASVVREKGHDWIHASVQPGKICSHAQCCSVRLR